MAGITKWAGVSLLWGAGVAKTVSPGICTPRNCFRLSLQARPDVLLFSASAAMVRIAPSYTCYILAACSSQSGFESWMMHSESIQMWRKPSLLVKMMACWKVKGMLDSEMTAMVVVVVFSGWWPPSSG